MPRATKKNIAVEVEVDSNPVAAMPIEPDNLHLTGTEPRILSNSNKPSTNPEYPGGVELMTFQGWTREPGMSRYSITTSGKRRFWCVVTTKADDGEPVNLDVVFWGDAADAMRYLVKQKNMRVFVRLREAMVSPAYADRVTGEIRNPTYNINFMESLTIVDKYVYEDETTRMIREMQEADIKVQVERQASAPEDRSWIDAPAGTGHENEEPVPF